MNNKIPCGGFYLSDTLGVDENGKLGVNGGEPYKSLVTDGEGGVQWEDRLAYVATEEQVIFSQENIAFTEISGALYGSEKFDMPETISAGEKLRVNFDGETYDCIAYINPIDLPTHVYIGNYSIFGGPDNTGEPFVMGYYSEEQKIDIATKLTSPTHTVSISRFVETVHKIPLAYFPEKTKVYVSSADDYMYFDSERTKKLSAEDFISAVNSSGIDFISLPISSVEGHLQMIDYGIIKSSGILIVHLSRVSSDGSTIDILTFKATSTGGNS